MILSLFSKKRSHDANEASTATSQRRNGNPAKKSRYNNNDTTLNNKASLSQHQTALQLSSLHLNSMQNAYQSSRSRYAQSKKEYIQCQLEMQEAKLWNDVIQSRWGVVDVDVISDSNTESSSDVPIVNAVSTESDEDVDGVSLREEVSTTNDDVVGIDCVDTINHEDEGSERRFEINCGEAIVNGIYEEKRLSHDIDNNTSSSIFVNSSGPYLIRHQYHNICLFKKEGYGDKFRWCLALVPITHTSHDIHATTSTIMEWDFHRAYIYYWMEMSCFNDNIYLGLFRNEWNACHGVRPVPALKDMSVEESGGWLWSKLKSILE